jgi:N-acetyl sugar amidotransferase
LRICKNCIQPDTRPGIFFTDDGLCGACLWEKEKQDIDWESRKKELGNIIEATKKNNLGTYDCAIGVSGGKDSTFQAFFTRDELNLRCLLVNYEPDERTEIGNKNLENLKKSGFDVISIRPNRFIMKKLAKYDFFHHLNIVKATEFPLYSSTYIIAEKFNIPLIIQGENPGLTLGTRLTGVGVDGNALKANELDTLSSGWQIYLKVEGVNEKDLFWFHYDRKKLESNGTRGIWLNYYIKEYSQHKNAEFSKKHGLIWRSDFDPKSIGTYSPYFQLDTDVTQVNQLLKFFKFGFGQCMDHVCYDVRENRLSRKEAIKLVLELDGKCSDMYIKKFCDYVDISLEIFWETIEPFRGKMWYKESGEWKNSVTDELIRQLDSAI